MKHPQIAALHQLFLAETQPFRKVHRLIDLFESILKTHTVYILAEYFAHNRISDSAKGLLATGLRTPSLGTWQLFARELFKELKHENHSWLITGFEREFEALDKALNSDTTNVIALRNGYAHGATPSDMQCESDIRQFEPFLNKLLQANWLQSTSLVERNAEVFLCLENDAISLHPLLLYREEGGNAPFAFFNDLKNDKVGLLNYPLSKHYREKEFYREFHSILPLHEWKKTGNNEFLQRIEELTETFKGRTLERRQLLQFVANKHKGYFSIQGNPGIGKSALIAQFFKDLRLNNDLSDVLVVEYFIRRGTQQAQPDYLFNYLIKRTDELFPKGKEIRAEGKMTFDLQNQLFSKWRLWDEEGRGKLLFLIDGLDEGAENGLANYLPRENFNNILIIYGSRPGGHATLDKLWGELPVEHHQKLELGGLGKDDIRALIYEVANKYEVERESAWVDAVQQRSQGNPLYLKLLCDALENGSIALNDIGALPKEIDEYYKAILQRYAADLNDGDALLAALYAFAAAKDFLTFAHLGLINQLGDATVQRIGSTLKEVLYENPLTDEVLDYQLFHESFREYLVKEKQKEVNDATERIVDFCANWRQLEGNWEQRYALEHYAAHLADSKKEMRADTLLQLLYDAPYANAQKKVLKNFDASNRLYRTILLKASDMQRFEEQLEAALCLVDLKYEEANDAPQVIELVSNGEIDLALKRIESFGGTDQEGVQRRFTLYMLCLIELTLLDSINKAHRKSAIEKLFLHLDEQLPVDHSILKWNDFFPSYIVFQMACEWAAFGLDCLIVYKRTDVWEKDWIKVKGPYTDYQFEVLVFCARSINNESDKCSTLKDISIELAKQGKLEQAIECARGISEKSVYSLALKDISIELTKQSLIEESTEALKEALLSTWQINDETKKNSALKEIAAELAIKGDLEQSILIAQNLNDTTVKSSAFIEISEVLLTQGKFNESSSLLREAIICVNSLADMHSKSTLLSQISTQLTKQQDEEKSTAFMQQAIIIAREIDDENDLQTTALKKIASEYILQGKLKESLVCVSYIDGDYGKCTALSKISNLLAKQGKKENAKSVMEQALKCACDSKESYIRNMALDQIGMELLKQGELEEAIFCQKEIGENSPDIFFLREMLAKKLAINGQFEESKTYANGLNSRKKSKLYKEITTIPANQGNHEKVASLFIEILQINSGIFNERKISSSLNEICIHLLKQGKIKESLSLANCITDDVEKSSIIMDNSCELFKQGEIIKSSNLMMQSIDIARQTDSSIQKIRILKKIIVKLANQNRADEAALLFQEALDCARNFPNDLLKNMLLSIFTISIVNEGKIEEALKCFQEISHEEYRNNAREAIAMELFKLGRQEESLTMAREILHTSLKDSSLKKIAIEFAKVGNAESSYNCAFEISDEVVKSSALIEILFELEKLKITEKSSSIMNEALRCARNIDDNLSKSFALIKITAVLFRNGKNNESSTIMNESIACAREIRDWSDKSIALANISYELYIQGKTEESNSFIQESLSCIKMINNDFIKSSNLNKIAICYAKLGDIMFTEKIGLGITLIAERHACWMELANVMIEQQGWQKTLTNSNKFEDEEARLFYLKGLSEKLKVTDVDDTCIQKALPIMVGDNESIENLMQKFAVRHVTIGNPSGELTARLNRTLNIQWAIDIAAQFPKPEVAIRLSTNLEHWLHEVEDEDDRDQIELWARQVAKGKITEAEFLQQVTALQ